MCYQKFDKNHDGKLDRDDFTAFLQSFTKNVSTRISTNILIFSFVLPLLVGATRRFTERLPKVGALVRRIPNVIFSSLVTAAFVMLGTHLRGRALRYSQTVSLYPFPSYFSCRKTYLQKKFKLPFNYFKNYIFRSSFESLKTKMFFLSPFVPHNIKIISSLPLYHSNKKSSALLNQKYLSIFLCIILRTKDFCLPFRRCRKPYQGECHEDKLFLTL